jgi:hypothetical protein
LLIIELDSQTLRADRLAYGKPAGVWAAMTGVSVSLVEAESGSELRSQLHALRRAGKTFVNVFVVCHSGPDGAVVGAHDPTLPWHELGALLHDFRPRRLVMLACSAGRWSAAKELFAEVPSLQDILASPVWASHVLGTHLIAVVPLLVFLPRASMQMLAAAFRGATLLADGGQLRHWTRADVERGDDTGRLLDIAAKLLDTPLRDMSNLYHRAMNRLFPRAQVPVPPRPPPGA